VTQVRVVIHGRVQGVWFRGWTVEEARTRGLKGWVRNRRDGTFQDVSLAAGIDAEARPGLGIVTGDFDDNGWMDVYIGNDGDANQLFMNQGDGTFREDSLLAGCAVNSEGAAEASMGIAAGDFDNDADEDLFMTHLTRETNTLYRNLGGGFFDDATQEQGLGTPSWSLTGFGTHFIDFDNDGDLDLATVNGGVTYFASGVRRELAQPKQLFRNLGDRFDDVSQSAGPAFTLEEVSRGLAAGDLDNDGDTDLVLSNNAGPARLLINSEGSRREWLGLRLTGEVGRDLLGARVDLLRGAKIVARRRVRTDGSYASANDPRLLFGLGEGAPGPLSARVRWPDGLIETFEGLEVRRYTELVRGTGRAERSIAVSSDGRGQAPPLRTACG